MRLLRRLLSDGGFELLSFSDDALPPYAILSHTWTEGQEVTYNELVSGGGKDKIGYNKICFCSDRAAADGLQFFWVDTCCINKSTSDELSTAINSMFRWYQHAFKCYVYLPDVTVPDEIVHAEAFPITWQEAFQRSRWFTRGWTLQELLAPSVVEFFCKQGKRLGTKSTLEQEIHKITKVPIEALRGQSLNKFSVEDRISWAAGRTTTMKEDKVYCLLGIFGVFLPLIYGEGEEYATLRLTEEIKKRQNGLGTESSSNLAVPLSLPFPRNELFIGRAYELRSLEKYFLSRSAHRRMSIYGLGGCGKSALALEFAYRVLARKASLVFWVPATSQESFELAYRAIGQHLCMPGITNDNANIKKLVKETLSSESVGDWLMIIDNADDHEVLLSTTADNSRPARLHDYLPHSNRGAILFTTRSRKVAGALTQNRTLRLSDMSKAEARRLLERQITKKTLPSDELAVDELLDIVTCLPLAIVQVAAFINNNDISVSDYISLFRSTGAETQLFHEHFTDPNRYEERDSTIGKTWYISFNQMRKQDRLAADYLSFMACIDRVNIPQSLLPPGGSLVQQVQALGTLTGYAFITERQQIVQQSDKDRFFDMHRLVHMASVWWLDDHDERAIWVDTTMARLNELLPHGGHEQKEVWTTYLPHAIHVTAIDGVANKTASASLLHRVGLCQASLGQYLAAQITHQHVLALDERMLGPEHPETLISKSCFAEALTYQGKHKEAEAMHRETLALRKKILGSKDPDTLTSMNNLALVLDRQGKYSEARAMHEETLALSEAVFGPEHPDTWTSMNNLALVLVKQGKHEEAESMHKKELTLRTNVLGLEHPDTLVSMNNLANVLSSQGNDKEAEAMLKQTLTLSKKVLGPEHPDTLTSMSNLASVLSSQGRDEEAEAMHEETLALRKKLLGPDHPKTLMSMYCLAFLRANQLRYDDSRQLYEQACAAFDSVLGENHPTARACRHNYCQLLALQERDRISLSLGRPESKAGVSTSKSAKILRGLAKIGISRSKLHIE